MTENVTLDDPAVTVRVRRSSRARRFTLSVSRVDGRPTLTLPTRAPMSEARMFLIRQSDWLAGAMARAPGAELVRDGSALPIGGRRVRLRADPARRRGAPRIVADELIVPGPPERAARGALAFLKTRARDALAPAAMRHAAALSRAPLRVTLRDTRSRWGSCTSDGALSFSWRLAMAPPDVLDYVAAHEAAHLVEMNHGPGFWALVDALRPDWREQRDWLRREGPALHRFRFEPAGTG